MRTLWKSGKTNKQKSNEKRKPTNQPNHSHHPSPHWLQSDKKQIPTPHPNRRSKKQLQSCHALAGKSNIFQKQSPDHLLYGFTGKKSWVENSSLSIKEPLWESTWDKAQFTIKCTKLFFCEKADRSNLWPVFQHCNNYVCSETSHFFY